MRTYRHVLIALSRLLLCFCGALLWAGCHTTQSSTSPSFRVMTYNIHHGEGLDGRIDLARIAALIQREGADIVGLQEVDQGVERTARRDMPAELAALTGMTCVFSNNFAFQGGQYGNAILSRFPVKHAVNTHYRMLRPGEQRGLLQLILDVRGQDLVFMTTHIDHRPDDSERVLNTVQIQEVLQGYGSRPVILTGDFNDLPGSRVCAKMSQMLEDAWVRAGRGDGFTYSSERPTKRIDYLWISRNPAVVPLRLWVPESTASDHLPLVGEFRLQ